jgi:hypothetical protein
MAGLDPHGPVWPDAPGVLVPGGEPKAGWGSGPAESGGSGSRGGKIRRVSRISANFLRPQGIPAEPPRAQKATRCAYVAPRVNYCAGVAFPSEARFDPKTNPRDVHTCATWHSSCY